MKYTILRDGEEFGPYDLDELPSFVADGNVVPTDLARPTEGGKTVAVAELLRTSGRGAATLPVLDHAATSVQPSNHRLIALAAVAVVAIALLAVAAWYLLRDDDKGITTAARYLPADSLAVLTLHIDDLADKSGLEEILRSQLGQEFTKDNPLLQNFGNSISEMPRKLGLLLDQPLFLFALPSPEHDDPLIGFILPVQSQSAVERGIKEIFGSMGAATLLSKMKKADGYRAFSEEGVPFVMGFNDDILVMLGSENDTPDLAARLRSLFKQESSLAKSHPDFGRHLEQDFDAGAWLNLTALLRIADIPSDFLGDLDRLGKMTLTLDVHFNNGVAKFRAGLNYDQQQLGNWTGGSLDSALLDALPSHPLAVLAQSVNMKTLNEYIQQHLPADMREEIDALLEDATDLGLNDLLDTLKGSIMIALTDMRPNPVLDVPSPDFLVGFSVKDSPQLDSLLARAEKNNGRLATLQIIHRPGTLFLCSDYTALQLKEETTPAAGPAHKLLRGHGAGGYVDFARLAHIGAKLNIPEEGLAALKKLETLSITSNTRTGTQEYVLTLTFKDKQRNSLRQLGDLGQLIFKNILMPPDSTFDESQLPALKN